MYNLELRHLYTLRALRDTGRFAAAAERVNLSQSAVSHQLKDLEERMQTKLLNRSTQPFEFTAAGSRLVQLADSVVPILEEAQRDVQRLVGGASGRLHLAVECHSCIEWLMPTINAYTHAWPDVDLDIATGFQDDPLKQLSEGRLDLVITSDPTTTSNLYYLPLFRYQAMLAVGTSHSLARERWVEPQDLAAETLITYPVEITRLDVYKYFLEPAGISPANVRTAGLTTLLIQLVANGRGVAGLPNWALNEYEEKKLIVTKPLGKEGVWSTLYAAIRQEALQLPYVDAFCELARSCCFEALEGIKPARFMPERESRASAV